MGLLRTTLSFRLYHALEQKITGNSYCMSECWYSTTSQNANMVSLKADRFLQLLRLFQSCTAQSFLLKLQSP